MNSYLIEQFLSEYFLFRCAAGKLISSGSELFDRLRDIFMLDSAETDGLYELTEDRLVADVKTLADYRRFCRIRKYSELTDCDDDVPPEIGEIIAVKGAALGKAAELKIDGAVAHTESAAYRLLSDSAAIGTVAALRILGYLRCEGNFVERDMELGLKCLEKAAQWNNPEGILAALYYDEARRSVNLSRLCTVTDGDVAAALFERAEARYGSDAIVPMPECKLLKKAFRAGTLRAELYAPQYARFIFSNILQNRDKERTMFSAGEQAISDTADLPLKLTFSRVEFDAAALSALPLCRDGERDYIINSMNNSDLRTHSTYNPLCICTDSDSVRKLYASALKNSFVGAHVEFIDVASLDEYDLEPTSNNIFVRSCDEDCTNVYVMTFTGKISERVFDEAAGFLQARRRRKFGLVRPGVVLDLGAVFTVCLCDKDNYKSLKPYCDVLSLAPAGDEEKLTVLDHIIERKKTLYGVHNITLDDAAKARLTGFSIDRAAAIIDRVIRFNRNVDELIITDALISKHVGAESGAKNRYGFGGDNNEI